MLRTIPAVAKLELEGEEQRGAEIVKKALEETMRWIAQNTGFDHPIVVGKVKKEKGNFGFNDQNELHEDLVKAGIIDPTKVVRCAIQNAPSVASLLFTTEALAVEKPKKEERMPAMPPGGGMY